MFKSAKQRAWMYKNKPEMAKEWESKTPKGVKLPETLASAIKKAKKSIGWKRVK